MMQIDTQGIRDGKHDGRVLYVCDFRMEDIHKKAGRKVPPTKVKVRPASDTEKVIYYSDSFLNPLNKKGEPLKKIIQLFDNTGYRSFSGNPVYVFDNMKECEMQWNELVLEVTRRIQSEIDNNPLKALKDELIKQLRTD